MDPTTKEQIMAELVKANNAVMSLISCVQTDRPIPFSIGWFPHANGALKKAEQMLIAENNAHASIKFI